jgi:hypothetical protein
VDEVSEVATRIIEFVGLLVAAGQKALIGAHSVFHLDAGELFNPPGNVHSAEGWEELLLPEIERQQQLGKEVAFGVMRPLPGPRSTRRWRSGA